MSHSLANLTTGNGKEVKLLFLKDLPKFKNLHILTTCGVEIVSHGICQLYVEQATCTRYVRPFIHC